MRFGLMTGADGRRHTLDDLIAFAQRAEAGGFDDLWMANVRAHDALMTLCFIGRATRQIRLGTAVTPTPPRHPSALAQQALTAAAATNNRFSLGIGPSHKVVTEDMLGLTFAHPARHTREYLQVLMPLLRGEICNFEGQEYRIRGLQLDVPDAGPVPVFVAALGPKMLELTGELADGTSTWMVGPKTMETHIVKTLHAAATSAGRPIPQVVGGFPIVLTNNVDAARARLDKGLAIYGQLPSYRAMLDREGLKGPGDLALVGDEAQLRSDIARIESTGVTHFNASIAAVESGAFDRTFDFLKSLR
ncbi:MAG: TIGR03564 family F420-dependent LLM class oxidoreductase [Gammaproteobacteria bacterium]